MAAVACPALMPGQVLRSSSTEYTVVDFMGEGDFGYVAKCRLNSTRESVAVKILKDANVQNVENELSMLEKIRELDPDHFNLVKFYERFEYSGYTCLVFEMLGMDLFDYLTTEQCSPMPVNEIRPIAKQMLVALQGLKSLQIIHADIKLDNIMLANIEDDAAIRVKLIDFGHARPSSSAVCGKLLQPLGHRAPEVCLGLPYTEAVDMWGLGCTLACLYLNEYLFLNNSKYLMMKSMVECLGLPSDHQLRLGMHTERFFCQEEDELGFSWRLLTPEEFAYCHGVEAEEWPEGRAHFYSLDDLVHIFEDDEEVKDRLAFIDFLKQLLHLDAGMRVSPAEALQHPFITMTHLSQDPDGADYLTESQKLMGTKASHSVRDVEMLTHIDTARRFDDVPKAPLSDVNHDNIIVLEPCQDWGKELHHHSTQDVAHVAARRFDEVLVTPASSQVRHIQTVPKVLHCEVNNGHESIQDPSRSAQVDSEIRSRSFKKKLRSFFSRIRTTFRGCWCPSVQE